MEKLYIKIYNKIKDDIASGILRDGDKIPTEFELMQTYSVSRITAQNAVRKLVAGGLVKRMRQKGTFVNIPKQSNIALALVLPFSSVFNQEIIRGAREQSLENGAILKVYNTYNDSEKERLILRQLINENVAGIMLYPTNSLQNLDIISHIYAKNTHLVFIDREIIGTKNPLVTSNNYKGMYDLVTKLTSKGYRRIGYFGVHNNLISTEKDRFCGYCSALMDNNISVNNSYIFPLSQNIVPKYSYANFDNLLLSEYADSMLKTAKNSASIPEVICCANDNLAISLISSAQKAHIVVPDQLSIAGFDNIEYSSKISPPLTTISQNFLELGKKATITLLNIISKIEPTKITYVDTCLIIRKSVAKL